MQKKLGNSISFNGEIYSDRTEFVNKVVNHYMNLFNVSQLCRFLKIICKSITGYGQKNLNDHLELCKIKSMITPLGLDGFNAKKIQLHWNCIKDLIHSAINDVFLDGK